MVTAEWAGWSWKYDRRLYPASIRIKPIDKDEVIQIAQDFLDQVYPGTLRKISTPSIDTSPSSLKE